MSNNATELDYTLTSLIDNQKKILRDAGDNKHSAVKNYFIENNKMAYYEPLQYLLDNTKLANDVVVQYSELSEKFAECLNARKQIDAGRVDGKNIFLDRLKEKDSYNHLSKAVTIDKVSEILFELGGLELKVIELKKAITDKLSVYVSSLETMNKFNEKVENITPDVMRYFYIVQMSLDTRKSLAADLTYLLEQMQIELNYLRKLLQDQKDSMMMRDIQSSVASLQAKPNLDYMLYVLNLGLKGFYLILMLIITGCGIKAFYWAISVVIPFTIFNDYLSYALVVLGWILATCAGAAVPALVLSGVITKRQSLPLVNIAFGSILLVYYSSSVKLEATNQYAPISIIAVVFAMAVSLGLMHFTKKMIKQSGQFLNQLTEIKKLLNP